MSTVAERVSAGAEMLDALEPGWRDRIDVETFDIYSTTHCVLGQLQGSYDSGVEYYGLDAGESAREYGFDLLASECCSEKEPMYWEALQEAWLNELCKPQKYLQTAQMTSNRDGVVSSSPSASEVRIFKESELMLAADGTWLMVDYCYGHDWYSWYVTESK